MRKRKPKVRHIAPDPRYSDPMITQFVNNLMWQGKKEHSIWKKALNNAMPQVEVRSRRIGGATFQIPTEIRAKRKVSIGMKWLIRFARQRSGKGMAEKMAAELIAASKGEGAAVKRKEDTHKMAESNRAFAHFRV